MGRSSTKYRTENRGSDHQTKLNRAASERRVRGFLVSPASATKPAALMPATECASSCSDTSPLTPTAPRIRCSADQIRTPPGTGMIFPPAVPIKADMNIVRSSARPAKARDGMPMAIALQALAMAMFGLKNEAPSSL